MEEDKRSPNSLAVVEVGMDEIPVTLGFNSQMPYTKDVESPNSCAVVVIDFDEIPLTLSVDFEVPCLHAVEVSPFHVIFDLNKLLIPTCFDKGSCTIIFRLKLKEFLEKCLSQFQVYIWSATWRHNIYNYLDHI
jgi:hypothetical protein